MNHAELPPMTSEALPPINKSCEISCLLFLSVILSAAKDLMAVANGVLHEAA